MPAGARRAGDRSRGGRRHAALVLERPGLWLKLPVVVTVAWLAREPCLWLPAFLLGLWVPLHAWAAEAAKASPGLQLLALLVAGLLLVCTESLGPPP